MKCIEKLRYYVVPSHVGEDETDELNVTNDRMLKCIYQFCHSSMQLKQVESRRAVKSKSQLGWENFSELFPVYCKKSFSEIEKQH